MAAEPDVDARLAALVTAAAGRVPDDVAALAAEHVADLVGVALAAVNEPAFERLAALTPTSAAGPGLASIWGTSRAAAPREAAFLNAFLGHFHDFDDDETELAMAHVTVTALPAAMAMAEVAGADGRDAVAAYVVGAETAMRIGQFVNPVHYRSGWHASATLGVFGAAAAAGALLRLDATRMRHALGMAASLAAGVRSNFGSDTKPLQVANAARQGVFAAEAALAGLTSTEGSVSGPAGWVRLFGGQAEAEPILAAFGAPFALSGSGLVIKAFPCCTATHSAVEALLGMLEDDGVDGRSVERIECRIDPAVPGILVHDRPSNGLEAKFSMPYCLAAATLCRSLGLDAFTDEAVQRPEVRALMAYVAMTPDASLPKGPSGISVSAHIAVTLRDGRRLERFCETPPGSPRRRLTHAQLRAKFLACAGSVLGASTAAAAFQSLLQAPSAADAGRLLHAVRPGG